MIALTENQQVEFMARVFEGGPLGSLFADIEENCGTGRSGDKEGFQDGNSCAKGDGKQFKARQRAKGKKPGPKPKKKSTSKKSSKRKSSPKKKTTPKKTTQQTQKAPDKPSESHQDAFDRVMKQARQKEDEVLVGLVDKLDRGEIDEKEWVAQDKAARKTFADRKARAKAEFESDPEAFVSRLPGGAKRKAVKKAAKPAVDKFAQGKANAGGPPAKKLDQSGGVFKAASAAKKKPTKKKSVQRDIRGEAGVKPGMNFATGATADAKAVAKFMGGADPVKETPKLVGSLPDQDVSFSAGKDKVRVVSRSLSADKKPTASLVTDLKRGSDGRFEIDNKHFKADTPEAKAELPAMLSRQIAGAAKNKVGKINFFADAQQSKNLARMGFDAPLEFAEKDSLPANLKAAKTVQDLMKTAAGRKHWKEKATVMRMTIDPSDSSAAAKAKRFVRDLKAGRAKLFEQRSPLAGARFVSEAQQRAENAGLFESLDRLGKSKGELLFESLVADIEENCGTGRSGDKEGFQKSNTCAAGDGKQFKARQRAKGKKPGPKPRKKSTTKKKSTAKKATTKKAPAKKSTGSKFTKTREQARAEIQKAFKERGISPGGALKDLAGASKEKLAEVRSDAKKVFDNSGVRDDAEWVAKKATTDAAKAAAAGARDFFWADGKLASEIMREAGASKKMAGYAYTVAGALDTAFIKGGTAVAAVAGSVGAWPVAAAAMAVSRVPVGSLAVTAAAEVGERVTSGVRRVARKFGLNLGPPRPGPGPTVRTIHKKTRQWRKEQKKLKAAKESGEMGKMKRIGKAVINNAGASDKVERAAKASGWGSGAAARFAAAGAITDMATRKVRFGVPVGSLAAGMVAAATSPPMQKRAKAAAGKGFRAGKAVGEAGLKATVKTAQAARKKVEAWRKAREERKHPLRRTFPPAKRKASQEAQRIKKREKELGLRTESRRRLSLGERLFEDLAAQVERNRTFTLAGTL